MNAEEIIKVINELCAKFGIVIDWTSQNVMPYLQELMRRVVTYQIIWRSALISLNIILFILMGIGTKLILNSRNKIKADKHKGGNFFWDFEGDMNDGGIYTVIFGLITIVVMLIVTGYTIMGLLKWIFTPELGLYEYIASLV